MLRRLVNAVAKLVLALALLACVAVAGFWYRSFGATDRADFLRGGHRYTARSDHGRVTVSGPPPPPRGLAPAVADGFAALARTLGDDALVWTAQAERVNGWPDLSTPRPPVGVHLRASGMNEAVLFKRLASGPEADGPLLAMLHRPEAFLLAHVLLTDRHSGRGLLVAGRPDPAPVPDPDRPPGPGPLPFTLNGVRAELTAVPRQAPPYPMRADRPDRLVVKCTAAVTDRAEMREVRRLWHDRLDVAVGSVPYAGVLGGTAALAVIATLLLVATRRRPKRDGGDPACGAGPASPARPV